jgi:hypothetical protein
LQMHTLVLVAMLVGSAQAQSVADSRDQSGAQQSGSIASAGPSYADQKEYESWVRPYRQFPPRVVDRLDSSGRIIADPTLLGITVVEGDDLPIDEKQARVLGNAYLTLIYSRTVSAGGRISYGRVDFDEPGGGRRAELESGIGGEDSPDLSKKALLELRRLLKELPDDQSRLPPPGRRLVIQAAGSRRSCGSSI